VRQRSISSISVVLVGILPALLGGPVFALFTAAAVVIAFDEVRAIGRRLSGGRAPTGYVVVAAAAFLGWAAPGERAVLLIAVAAVGLPLVRAVFTPVLPGRAAEWAFATAGTLYLAVPAYAMTSLRGTDGANVATWLTTLADALAFGWESTPRGLGWVLMTLLIAWLSDTMAYLVGRAFGRHKLIPRISPNKTVEGAVGGVVGAAVTAAVCVSLFGLGIPPLIGFIAGLAIGSIGIVGDLGESLLKREAGVKDSGTLIPGHGGMLDRIDALLFIVTVVWLLQPILDGLST
jgi:phosphatidate cytidylyltransferase